MSDLIRSMINTDLNRCLCCAELCDMCDHDRPRDASAQGREVVTRENGESKTVASIKSEPTEDVAAEHPLVMVVDTRPSRQEQCWKATNMSHSQQTGYQRKRGRISEDMNCSVACT